MWKVNRYRFYLIVSFNPQKHSAVGIVHVSIRSNCYIIMSTSQICQRLFHTCRCFSYITALWKPHISSSVLQLWSCIWQIRTSERKGKRLFSTNTGTFNVTKRQIKLEIDDFYWVVQCKVILKQIYCNSPPCQSWAIWEHLHICPQVYMKVHYYSVFYKLE